MTRSVHELSIQRPRRRCDPEGLGFETTGELEPLAEVIGQDRAREALQFGLAIPSEGYHLFVVGPPGTGKTSIVATFLESAAASRPCPDDWCYVNHFADSNRPRALRLPAGLGCRLERVVRERMTELERELPLLFDSEEYRREVGELRSELADRQQRLVAEIMDTAVARDFRLLKSSQGVIAVPVVEGTVVPPAKVGELPEEVRQRLEAGWREVQSRLEATNRRLRDTRQEITRRIRDLDHDVIQFAVSSSLLEVREELGEVEVVAAFLEDLQADLVQAIIDYKQALDGPAPERAKRPDPALYGVNLLVDNGGRQGAPVVVEPNPTLVNLVGRVEHDARNGAMLTDFSMIRAGALHRANGGYLVLEAQDVVLRPFLWEVLKRALRDRQVTIEPIADERRISLPRTLAPAPIPLDVKVVMVGDGELYRALYELDEEFSELFKVKVEFASDTPWTAAVEHQYARFVGDVCRTEELPHFEPGGVARVIEQAARMAEHGERLSTRFGPLRDLVREAAYWARSGGAEVVGADQVRTALAARERRANLAEERLRELVSENTLLLDTEGERVGQVNGLVVASGADRSFGRPVRVTARSHAGTAGLVNIEREAALGGRLHTKGVLILAGFLGGRFALDVPLALTASLTLEQSYSTVDGDSASSTELYALLSSLSGIALRQDVAVTGSVNQHGEVQAIGGVNEKVEGFFALCRERGLTGRQGVMIPAANVRHLMLEEDVAAAVDEGRFHLWAVATVDEGVELLTGRPAGERGDDGRFPEGTVYLAVENRLRQLAEVARRYASRP